MGTMDTAQRTDDFAALAAERDVMLTTFKRNGTAVGTPVWLVVRDGVIYTTTAMASGKVKRIRRDGHVTVAACTARGKVTGPTYAGYARLLSPGETREIAIAKQKRYRLLNTLIRLINRVRREGEHVGIAIVATPAP